ncbi:3-dehydroquinate synthase [Taibaiella lutea]|uniref:3-dehydroquinate synthase n=1 Tax=Taibaiella lutea TaxID=2608001 RepID=A0A5M6CI94_9BACT|nr:3-dehydroquinate synthase [Taibaiella lutea]KAA5534743.1 3-dehydroquinate synthase [Taibaiella lutea]
MHHRTYNISGNTTQLYFDASFDLLKQLAPPESSFIITDENVMLHYQKQFKSWKVITIPAGEASKNLEALDDIIRQLIALEADRDATIIGVGGGVVTDIAGFVAGIYKRGVKCGFVPTSVLGMVDASLGGKNGLDIGEYKNMAGLIRQPSFILYDFDLLKTLPKAEWINGFAEIIKHTCILDADMFDNLKEHSIEYFQKDKEALALLIERNALLKMKVVEEDEFETGIRKILNFGHTLGHAIENVYELPHGYAISIGMAFAAKLSSALTGFENTEDVIMLLKKYHLPVHFGFNIETALANIQKDKKRKGSDIQYVLLTQVGTATVEPLDIVTIEGFLRKDIHADNH